MLKEEILNLIKGDNGLISSVGKANISKNIGKGPLTSAYSTDSKEIIEGLNALAKVYLKGREGSAPYTAIIEVQDTKGIYISSPGFPPFLGWKEGCIASIFNALLKLIVKKDVNSKIELFKTFISSDHVILQPLLNNKAEEEKQKFYAKKTNNFTLFESLKKGRMPNNLDEQEEMVFKDFATKAIDKIVGLNHLKDIYDILKDKKITLVPFKGKDDPYYGVHVEVKGLHFAKNINKNVKNFNIGLATIKQNEQPGCCFGCSSEFNAIQKVENYSLNRIGDFLENFPPTNYKASQNINSDNTAYEFGKIVYVKSKQIINKFHSKEYTLIGKLKILGQLINCNYNNMKMEITDNNDVEFSNNESVIGITASTNLYKKTIKDQNSFELTEAKKTKTAYRQVDNKKIKLNNTLNEWWDPQQIIFILKNKIPENIYVVDPALNEMSLSKSLTDISINGIYKKFILPLVVHSVTKEVSKGDSGKDTNHWVAFYIIKQQNICNHISYVDPMGHKINEKIKNCIFNIYNNIEIKEPALNKNIQFVTLNKDQYYEGNINDCGPLLVHLLLCIINSEELPCINNLKESLELGQDLRKKLINSYESNDHKPRLQELMDSEIESINDANIYNNIGEDKSF